MLNFYSLYIHFTSVSPLSLSFLSHCLSVCLSVCLSLSLSLSLLLSFGRILVCQVSVPFFEIDSQIFYNFIFLAVSFYLLFELSHFYSVIFILSCVGFGWFRLFCLCCSLCCCCCLFGFFRSTPSPGLLEPLLLRPRTLSSLNWTSPQVAPILDRRIARTRFALQSILRRYCGSFS